MKFNVIRAIHTTSSERFLIQVKEGEDAAAIDLHYLRDGSVAGTLCVFEGTAIPEDAIPDILRQIDHMLLPHVSLDRHTVTFTVVKGRVLGHFSPQQEEDEAE
jgi:hypothetical protein